MDGWRAPQKGVRGSPGTFRARLRVIVSVFGRRSDLAVQQNDWYFFLIVVVAAVFALLLRLLVLPLGGGGGVPRTRAHQKGGSRCALVAMRSSTVAPDGGRSAQR